MKNLKKVLAMVLAFACTFTMFAGAKVFEDVPAGSDYSEAITMLSDLGIIKGKTETTYAPDETITREEACTLIARLLTGEQDVVGFENAQNFTDTKYSWAKSAIGYCVVNGIVVGDGNGKFRPMDKITDAEFVTMVVRAMGYETADMKQNYPHSYLSAAMARGLLDNVNMVATSDALRGENAQIIFNALFAQYKRYGDDQKTLAEAVWGLQQAYVESEEVKENDSNQNTTPLPHDKYCNSHTWVIIGEAQDDPNAFLAYPIDDKKPVELFKSSESKQQYLPYKFKYEGDMSNIEALKGYKVELFGKKEHGKGTVEKEQINFTNWSIQSIKTVKGQAVHEYNASMADKKAEDGTIDLGETQLSLENVAVNNARNVQSTDEVKFVDTFMGDKLNTISIKDEKSVEKALNVRNGNQYRLMDWDGDNEIDWVVVDQANYYKVESATSKRVTVTSMKDNKDMDSRATSETATWKLDEEEKIGENNLKKDIRIKYEVPEGLKEGDIVEVTYKVSGAKNSQLITATVTVVDAENQKLEKVGSRDGLTLTFGDEELKVAQNANLGNVIVPNNPQDYKGFNGEELGTEFALWQDRNGFIVYSDYATDVSDYMMVLDTGDGNSSSTNNRKLAAVDMKTQDNSVKKDVQVADDLRVLDASGNVMTGAYDEDTRSFDESQIVGNVFKYWTNEDGIITKMQAVISFEKNSTTTSGKDTYEYNPDTYVLSDNGYKADLEDARVIFAVKPWGNTGATGNDGYIQATTDSNGNTDLKVNADDVLAVSADDLATISNKKSDATHTAKLDSSKTIGAGHAATWLDPVNKLDYDLAFVASLDNNKDAVGAVLGVNDFTKFGAQNVKVGLVTNVSERNGGIVEIDVASGGKVETFSTAEKTKFSDVVKVFNGSTDVGVAGVDSLIKDNENKIFDGESLSTVINEGGMYAEITTDADGKLLRVVFMDDVAGEENYIKGHYYEVTRNVVTNVKDNKSIYFQKNTKDDPALYAGEGKLYSVDYLNQDYGAFASDANYYEIDAEPTRHDRDYSNSNRMTVNAGFDNLRLGDITTIEAGDINYQPIHNTTNNDAYAVADIAKKMGGDVVAVYSFKGDLDEVANNDVVLIKGNTTVQAGETLNVKLYQFNGTTPNDKVVSSLKVYDEKGNDVSANFSVAVKTENQEYNVTVGGTVANGKYTIKAMKNDKEAYAGSLTIDVTDAAKFNVTEFGFGKNGKSGWENTKNELTLMTGMTNTIPVVVKGEKAKVTQPEGVKGLNEANFTVMVGNNPATITRVDVLDDGVYGIVLDKNITTSDAVQVKLNQVGSIASIGNTVSDTILDTKPEEGSSSVGNTEDWKVVTGQLTGDDFKFEEYSNNAIVATSGNLVIKVTDKEGNPVGGLKERLQVVPYLTTSPLTVTIDEIVGPNNQVRGVYRINRVKQAAGSKNAVSVLLDGKVLLENISLTGGTVSDTVENTVDSVFNEYLDETGMKLRSWVKGKARTDVAELNSVDAPYTGGLKDLSAENFVVTLADGTDVEVLNAEPVDPAKQPGLYDLTLASSLSGEEFTLAVTAQAGDTPVEAVVNEQNPVVETKKRTVRELTDQVYKTDDKYIANFGWVKDGYVIKNLSAGDLGLNEDQAKKYIVRQWNPAFLNNSTSSSGDWISTDDDTLEPADGGKINTTRGVKVSTGMDTVFPVWTAGKNEKVDRVTSGEIVFEVFEPAGKKEDSSVGKLVNRVVFTYDNESEPEKWYEVSDVKQGKVSAETTGLKITFDSDSGRESVKAGYLAAMLNADQVQLGIKKTNGRFDFYQAKAKSDAGVVTIAVADQQDKQISIGEGDLLKIKLDDTSLGHYDFGEGAAILNEGVAVPGSQG